MSTDLNSFIIVCVSSRDDTCIMELSTEFLIDYCKRAGIAGQERALLMAYLFYMAEVIKPAQGLHENRELLYALVSRWGI